MVSAKMQFSTHNLIHYCTKGMENLQEMTDVKVNRRLSDIVQYDKIIINCPLCQGHFELV